MLNVALQGIHVWYSVDVGHSSLPRKDVQECLKHYNDKCKVGKWVGG